MVSIDFRNCDCLDLLSSVDDNSVNLVLIDPPYMISRDTGFRNGKLKKYETVSMDFGDWDKTDDVLYEVILECYRVLTDNGYLICFYDLWKITTLKNYLENANFKQLRFIEWLKTNPVPLNSQLNYLTNSREIAVTGVKKGKPCFHSKYDNGVYEYPIYHKSDRFHPTQKPLELFEELILKHSNKGDTVLDCFTGGGTTPVACLLTDRNFIGCELDKEYYRNTVDRINLVKGQSKLI